MSVKLELYRVFKEVAEAGNITAAAQALYISQSAVSQSIKQLEGELQTRLFARNSRGVALTPDGRMLYEYVRSAIDATPDRTYRGRIGFISPTAEFTPKTVETKEVRNDLVFRFRVIADDPDNVMRQGMPVTVTLRKDGGKP